MMACLNFICIWVRNMQKGQLMMKIRQLPGYIAPAFLAKYKVPEAEMENAFNALTPS